MREDHSFRKHLLENENALVGIERIFVPAALRGLDYHLDLLIPIQRL
jgi:hypothetical protein